MMKLVYTVMALMAIYIAYHRWATVLNLDLTPPEQHAPLKNQLNEESCTDAEHP